MRPLAFTIALVAAASPAAFAAEIPPLLKQVLVDASQEAYYWAYTETTIYRGAEKDGKQEPDRTYVTEFDPSRPYPDQFVPIFVANLQPTNQDWRRARAAGAARGKVIESATRAAKKDTVSVDQRSEKSLSEVLDVPHIAIAEESANTIIYSVPLLKGAEIEGFPMDKFDMFVRVDKANRRLENLTFRAAKTRLKLLVNVRSAEISMDFAQIEPDHAPVVVRAKGVGSFTVLAAESTLDFVMTHTDLRRVQPYNEQLGVQIGPLKFLKF